MIGFGIHYPFTGEKSVSHLLDELMEVRKELGARQDRRRERVAPDRRVLAPVGAGDDDRAAS